MGSVAPMILFGQTETPSHFTFKHRRNKIVLLLACSEIPKHQHLNQIADDAALVLQVIMETETFVREMMSDDRHRQIAAILPAIFFWNGKTIMTGAVGNLPHFGEQRPPIRARMPVIVPVGPGMFTAMVKKADIVVAVFNRLDFALDKFIENREIVSDFFWNRE